jgi:hypothetical protein
VRSALCGSYGTEDDVQLEQSERSCLKGLSAQPGKGTAFPNLSGGRDSNFLRLPEASQTTIDAASSITSLVERRDQSD